MRYVALWVVACLLAGCGTSNRALRGEHYLTRASAPAGEEMVVMARLTGRTAVTTEYNLRYKLQAQVADGEYELRWVDGVGGRYFVHRGGVQVALRYDGVALTAAKPEQVDGGVAVDAQGAAYIFWLWDGPLEPATRIAAPGLQVAISTEVDQRQRDARLAREANERRDREARELAEAERRRDEEMRQTMRRDLAAAKQRARVSCVGAECERVFARAQVYLLQQSDMRIQVATSTLIETYNATEDGRVQMRLLRAPTSGDRWEIMLTAECRDDRKALEVVCLRRLTSIYSGFLPHMQGQ